MLKTLVMVASGKVNWQLGEDVEEKLTFYCIYICILFTAILRYISHTIKFIHLKCTVKCFLIYYSVLQPSPKSNFRTFSALHKENTHTEQSFSIPSFPALGPR